MGLGAKGSGPHAGERPPGGSAEDSCPGSENHDWPRLALRDHALEVLRAAGRVGGRRLGERPALAARGHRGNYTPRCRRLPARPRIPLQLPSLLRATARSILARARGKRGGGQLPLGTSRDFSPAARSPGSRPTSTSAWEAIFAVAKELDPSPGAARCLQPPFTLQLCPLATPDEATLTPPIPARGVSLATPWRTGLSPTPLLDPFPETSEALFSQAFSAARKQSHLPPPTVYTIPESVFEAVNENSGFGLRVSFFN
jgi:hypothetical protein